MLLTIMIMNMISLILGWMKHPISVGLLIITQTINISLMLGMLSGTFLFSYIIIIIMLSGVLVLFIYMASIASNEKFNTPISLIHLTLLMIIIGLIGQFIFNHPMEMEFNKPQAINNLESLTFINLINNYKIITLMVIYLFFTMMVVSLIVTISDGPLRIKK
uniref:NADH dehydrogenase subunit 6 n=1 Tax=Melamphaus rubrocinctus TaxID=238647 RepID=A0A4Y1JVU9_9HEMI|nr:NADH dehydrogenase subunit 6 [Melamphaus rubrocinctus]APO08868.1 NADH dehydrogenase subunit 6 [Melamphaus rubrocinctus]